VILAVVLGFVTGSLSDWLSMGMRERNEPVSTKRLLEKPSRFSNLLSS
jgi:hypothetical protein